MRTLKHPLKKVSLKKVSDVSMLGSLGLIATLVLSGCDSGGGASSSTSSGGSAASGIADATKKGASVTIEKQPDGSYKILDEFPSDTTRVILRENGEERILSQEEIDKLIAQENQKIEQGTSQLTNPTGGGLSLGETILASAAGAILGSWIGSKLFNNQNFQNQQRTSYKSPQAYERSQNSFNRGSTSSTAGRSGFYSPNSASNTPSRAAGSTSSSSSSSSSYGG